MKLNLFKNLSEGLQNVDVNKFIEEIKERLNKMEQELVIDRFEGNIAVCEDRKTKKMYHISKDELPKDVVEGTVLKYENGKYVCDKEKEEEISERIKRKMDDLWN